MKKFLKIVLMLMMVCVLTVQPQVQVGAQAARIDSATLVALTAHRSQNVRVIVLGW